MLHKIQQLDEVTIRFAGDSGDGMQLTGTQFTNATALFGNDLSTFPDFPAEIRAPQGTVAGVSGFQIHFGSKEIHTAGDFCDVLVAMNLAALKANLKDLKKGGVIIANEEGFDIKNMRLAKVTQNPLEDDSLQDYQVIKLHISHITKDILKDSGLGSKEIERSKNMFVLGLLCWLYNRPTEATIKYLEDKFSKTPDILNANITLLKAGWNYGETTEVFTTQYHIQPAKIPAGTYRNITGNTALSYGLIAAAQQSGLPLFLGAYPITPASDVLHELSRHKNFGIKTFQAEDEIAAITSAIGASYGGNLGVTVSSGPGIALKTEALGLAVMLELPLVVCNIQRGGPSTGLPTKTEQSDLLQAVYGRNGETPMPVVAPASPSECFDMAFEACRLAIDFMTPIFLLSDGNLANASEPWRFPQTENLPKIEANFATLNENESFLPYRRNQKLARQWAIPGIKGLEHRIGGLEKQNETGNISYDAQNHEFMVKVRQEKIDNIANYIPNQKIETGKNEGKLLLVGWGSTLGSLKVATQKMIEEGMEVSHIQIRYLNPLPSNLGEILKRFETVVVAELNNGQLIKILRDKYLVDAIGLNKIQGQPFATHEIEQKVKQHYQS